MSSQNPINRCSFPREPINACGTKLLTMWQVRADSSYHTIAERSRLDSQGKIEQAGKNLVIVRTHSGSGTLIANHQPFNLTANSLLIFDFPSLQEYRTSANHWHFWWVELATTEPLHLPLFQTLTIPQAPDEPSRCAQIFDKLQSPHYAQTHLATALWQTLYYEWWTLSGIDHHPLSRHEKIMQSVIEAIHRAPHLPWSSEDMANVAHVSTFCLRQSCKSALATSPSQVRLQIKLAHAYEYLRRGDLTISQISDTLGFCDPYHFSKSFKKHYGSTPSTLLRPHSP